MFWGSDRKTWCWLTVALLPCMVGSGQDKVAELAIPAGLRHVSTEGMVFSLRGEMLALPRQDGGVDLLDVAAEKWDVLPAPAGARLEPGRVAFAHSGRSLASMNPGLGITIWDVVSKKPGNMLSLGPEIYVLSMAFLNDDRTLQATNQGSTGDELETPWDYSVVRWNVATGERRGSDDFGRHPLTMNVSPNGRYGIVNTIHKMLLCDFKAGGKTVDLGESDTPAIFSDDSSTLIVCDHGLIKFLDVPSGREQRRLAVAPSFHVTGLHLALSADTRLLAVGGYPKPQTAVVISLATGEVLATVTCGPDLSLCRSVQLSPDGHTLATNTDAGDSKDRPSTPDLKLWKIPASW